MGDDVASRWLGFPAPFVALAFMAVLVVTAGAVVVAGSAAEPDGTQPDVVAVEAPADDEDAPSGAPTASPTAEEVQEDDESDPEGTGTGDAVAPAIPVPAATTVQVLDGGAGPDATADAVSVLQGMGYDIVAVNDARCCYDVTTVLFTSGNEPVADALAGADGRFAEIRANPNLSEEVHLHVVVGTDWGG